MYFLLEADGHKLSYDDLTGEFSRYLKLEIKHIHNVKGVGSTKTDIRLRPCELEKDFGKNQKTKDLFYKFQIQKKQSPLICMDNT